MKPLTMPSAVDLPAPFGPTRPCTSPGRTVKLASSTALTPLNCLETPLTTSSSAMVASSRTTGSQTAGPVGHAGPRLAEVLDEALDGVLHAGGDADAQAPRPHHEDDQQDQLEGERGVLADRRRLDGDDGHDGGPDDGPRRGANAADEQHREDQDADVAVEVVGRRVRAELDDQRPGERREDGRDDEGDHPVAPDLDAETGGD